MFNDSIVQGIKKFEFDTILILKIENLLQQILFYTNGKLPGTELNTRQTLRILVSYWAKRGG